MRIFFSPWSLGRVRGCPLRSWPRNCIRSPHPCARTRRDSRGSWGAEKETRNRMRSLSRRNRGDSFPRTIFFSRLLCISAFWHCNLEVSFSDEARKGRIVIVSEKERKVFADFLQRKSVHETIKKQLASHYRAFKDNGRMPFFVIFNLLSFFLQNEMPV